MRMASPRLPNFYEFTNEKAFASQWEAHVGSSQNRRINIAVSYGFSQVNKCLCEHKASPRCSDIEVPVPGCRILWFFTTNRPPTSQWKAQVVLTSNCRSQVAQSYGFLRVKRNRARSATRQLPKNGTKPGQQKCQILWFFISKLIWQ